MLIFSFIAEIIPLDQRVFVKMTMPINIYIVYTTSERELLTNFMDPIFLDQFFFGPFFWKLLATRTVQIALKNIII